MFSVQWIQATEDQIKLETQVLFQWKGCSSSVNRRVHHIIASNNKSFSFILSCQLSHFSSEIVHNEGLHLNGHMCLILIILTAETFFSDKCDFFCIPQIHLVDCIFIEKVS